MGATATCRGLLAMGCLLTLLPFIVLGKSCHSLKLTVPSILHTGDLLGTVNLKSCMHPNEVVGGTNTPNFRITRENSHYAIYCTRDFKMPAHSLPFGIILRDKGSKKEKLIHVKLVTKEKAGKTRHVRELLRRTKRRWRPMPFSVNENYIGVLPKYVETIQSDTMENYTIIYSITGPGVDQPPIGLFTINGKTGAIYINGRVDREEYPVFQLMGYAKTADGYAPESPLDLTVVVEDDNDNAPIFTEESFCAEVLENSKQGTVVGRVSATDRDQPMTAHTLLRYYLIQQIPPSPIMFSMDSEHGIVTTTANRLDRERQDHYTLLIEVRDMGGNIGYLSSTGTMTITVLDINDFAPSFVKQSYEIYVNENESGKVILKIPVVDNDLAKSPNWRAVFSIIKGNELGYFNISTDLNTNDGLLTVTKEINYEESKQFVLQVAVANEVSLITQSGTKTSGVSTIPVTVIVRDVDEGPECKPAIREVGVKEEQPIGTLIGVFPAADPETKGSTGIRYTVLSDPLSLFNIDANTARITTAKVLDYESREISSHKYNFTYVATDQSGKSGTCKIVMSIEDVSEGGTPEARKENILCADSTSVRITASIESMPSNMPLRISLDTNQNPGITSQFKITSQTGNTVNIEAVPNLPDGEYLLRLIVANEQGQGDTQTVIVKKCNCNDGQTCTETRSSTNVSLGGLAILVMILSALLLALLAFLLTACLCGAGARKTKAGIPDDDGATGTLIGTNTEAPGVDVLAGNYQPSVNTHIVTNPGLVGSSPSGFSESGQKNWNNQVTKTTSKNVLSDRTGGGQTMPLHRDGHRMMETNRHTYGEWHSFVNSHLGQKVLMCGQDEDGQHGEDYVVPYNYEGKGSMAGSVGCCSELRGEEDRLDFLNQLEPKFRTLAEICAKK